MKAKLRKKQKQMELEQSQKKKTDSSKNSEIPKKKLISIPSQKTEIKNEENSDEINNMNKIQNIPASRPANNVDVEKISQRIKERKERKKRKNKIENIEPVFVDNNVNDNINENVNNNNINLNNNEKDNKNAYDSESVAPIPVSQKNNINPIQAENINNNNINHKIISVSSSSHSINKNEIQSSISTPNYQFLSKNYYEIKPENVKDFLINTNPEKPIIEQKEYEVQKMVKLMELKPKAINIKENKEEEQNFTYNLMQKIKENKEYIENQKEIKELKIKIKDEEKKIENLLDDNKKEIKEYIEKITKLQNILLNSQQGDVFYLEEENKIDEIQIQNLSSTLQKLNQENEREKYRINDLVNGEISLLTNDLNKEISEVQKIKRQLEAFGKKKPPRDIIKKIEVVMRYMKKNVSK